MSRPLSAGAIAALLAQRTNEAFILLVTFSHAATSEVFRAALNTEVVVSNGEVFTPTYFEVTLPEEGDRAPQGCQITVDNVDRRLVGLLRSITTPLDVQIQLVMASTPDIVEMEFNDLVLREVDWDVSKITGTLVSEDPLNQVFTGHLYGPQAFPGIF
jgi:hypothetical protein